MEKGISYLNRTFNDYRNSLLDYTKQYYPELEDDIITCAEWVKRNVGVADALDAVKSLVVILTVVLSALMTVLMERSFITKEQGEI